MPLPFPFSSLLPFCFPFPSSSLRFSNALTLHFLAHEFGNFSDTSITYVIANQYLMVAGETLRLRVSSVNNDHNVLYHSPRLLTPSINSRIALLRPDISFTLNRLLIQRIDLNECYARSRRLVHPSTPNWKHAPLLLCMLPPLWFGSWKRVVLRLCGY